MAVPTSDIWSKLRKAVLDGFGTLRDIKKLGVVVESVDLPNNELHNGFLPMIYHRVSS